MIMSACGRETFQHVDIFFTADTNGFYSERADLTSPNSLFGGYGILKSFLSTRTEPYLLFDGGNWFGSSPESTLTKGAFIVPFLQEIPYTAGTISAADFSYGWPALRNILKNLKTPFVAANLQLENKLPWPLHDYQIRTIGTVKIGIFGLVSLQEPQFQDKRLYGLHELDALQTAQQMVALLKEKGVNYIILLSSLGSAEWEKNGNITIAQEVQGIDLILTSAQGRPRAETETIGNTLLVYPKERLESVAHVRVSFDKNNRVRDQKFQEIALLKEMYGMDDSLTTQAFSLRSQTGEKMRQKVTSTSQTITTSLTQESPLGALLTQCLHQWAKLDGAILNASSIRDNLNKGNVMEYDVYKMYPYGDNITFVTMKGKDWVQALQNSLNAADNFPQVAGFSVRYVTTPAGKLVQRVTLANGRIVRPEQTYRIATTDHVLAGGFGHDGFINALEFKNTFVEVRQIIRACLLKQKQIAIPVSNHFEEVK